jgi:hypothetical protein
MLDAFIIEQIRRREQPDERRQPRLEIPARFPIAPPESWERDHDHRRERDADEHEGVVILDM